MRFTKVVLLVTLLLATVYSAALTYTFSGAGTGSLNGVSFTNTDFTFVTTSTIFTSASFTITGIGSGTLGPGVVFVNTGGASICPTFPAVSSAVGFGTTEDIVDVCNNAFSGYSLSSPIGPTPAIPFPVGNPGNPFPTSAGLLIFTSFASGTYTATVPEPAGLVLLATGLFATVGAVRRRTRV